MNRSADSPTAPPPQASPAQVPTSAPALSYPLQIEPQTGTGVAVTVAPGVLWLRMPLFASLKWINVWALADDDGWVIVDTGLRSSNTLEAWQAAFAGAMAGARVTRVLVTHMHPDHCGMAGWLVERFRTRLWMSQLEYFTCRLMAADTGHQAPAAGIDFYRAAGWDDQAIEHYQAIFGSFGEMIYPLPASYRRLADGDHLRVGAHSWHVVVGSGHSPEHVCLYCPQLKLFISGDQVLPGITSNVSVHPTEPDANPLHDWLTSLASIPPRIPDDVLVLPAHNSPFHGLHARTQQLIDRHLVALTRLEQQLSEPRRTVDVFASLFSRVVGADQLGAATGEAMAHLNYLLASGRITRDRGADGVWWWRTEQR